MPSIAVHPGAYTLYSGASWIYPTTTRAFIPSRDGGGSGDGGTYGDGDGGGSVGGGNDRSDVTCGRNDDEGIAP